MKRRQVVMLRTYDQHERGSRPHLEDDLVEFLVAHGYAVLALERATPVGPSETQVIGPSEIKQTAKKKRHG